MDVNLSLLPVCRDAEGVMGLFQRFALSVAACAPWLALDARVAGQRKEVWCYSESIHWCLDQHPAQRHASVHFICTSPSPVFVLYDHISRADYQSL
jgi:hypothetical protein